ncbi:non-homologous end-joining DNA ligase [Brevibacillus sp. SYSU BS000544]|uniref:non-homologous end-joining DNA ligase n=1 Tax=Brevibacillus sp. SYSU BS000544 TaxID=3416443 RepID=UPI003CE4797C
MGTATGEKLQVQVNDVTITISNPDKIIWKKNEITKISYLEYLIRMAPYMLPHLENRVVTVIRYPDGIAGEKFYQKHCPAYAPDFVRTYQIEDINYILCNDLATLLWLGNQAAIELHVPFTKINSPTGKPEEIVFDLDPPSQQEFHLAIRAALMMKEIFDKVGIHSFVKTSGNKGLQVYIPLPLDTYSFDQTRVFTKFIADYLTAREPNLFTTERLKKNRGNRLYLDYVQHADGKTIIAPYSARGTDVASVATPLYWSEVTQTLHPSQFTIQNVHERVLRNGCPFQQMEESRKKINLDDVLSFIHHESQVPI